MSGKTPSSLYRCYRRYVEPSFHQGILYVICILNSKGEIRGFQSRIVSTVLWIVASLLSSRVTMAPSPRIYTGILGAVDVSRCGIQGSSTWSTRPEVHRLSGQAACPKVCAFLQPYAYRRLTNSSTKVSTYVPCRRRGSSVRARSFFGGCHKTHKEKCVPGRICAIQVPSAEYRL